jgi:ATPases of the AAA+ class
MSEFIKAGKNIFPKPVGCDYDLIAGKVYDLNWDGYNCTYIFSENGDLNLPSKVYNLKKDVPFKKRILTYFKETTAQTTGVMLAGTKGTGKTVLSKVIAKESGLPIIIVDGSYPAQHLSKFFKGFKTPVCIIFDEIEKKWRTDRMLEFLDGVEATTKKLVLMTCNDINLVSQYMQDRCSRVRYLRTYGDRDDIELIETLVKDHEIEDVKGTTDFIINNIKLLSIDNVLSFIKEVKLFGSELTLDEIIEDMNISLNKQKTNTPINSISLSIDAPIPVEDDCDEDNDWEEMLTKQCA